MRQIFKSLPGFVEHLLIFLHEVGDLISQASCFARGKNFARKALVDLSQVVIHLEDNECNQALTLSANEKGNRRRQIASMETPLGLAYQKRTERCRFVSSKGVSPNWDYCTVNMSAGLSSKLLASTVGRAMLEAIP